MMGMPFLHNDPTQLSELGAEGTKPDNDQPRISPRETLSIRWLRYAALLRPRP